MDAEQVDSQPSQVNPLHTATLFIANRDNAKHDPYAVPTSTTGETSVRIGSPVDGPSPTGTPRPGKTDEVDTGSVTEDQADQPQTL